MNDSRSPLVSRIALRRPNPTNLRPSGGAAVPRLHQPGRRDHVGPRPAERPRSPGHARDALRLIAASARSWSPSGLRSGGLWRFGRRRDLRHTRIGKADARRLPTSGPTSTGRWRPTACPRRSRAVAHLAQIRRGGAAERRDRPTDRDHFGAETEVCVRADGAKARLRPEVADGLDGLHWATAWAATGAGLLSQGIGRCRRWRARYRDRRDGDHRFARDCAGPRADFSLAIRLLNLAARERRIGRRGAGASVKTCLVVDDSRVIRKVARRILEDLGFEIAEASDGWRRSPGVAQSCPRHPARLEHAGEDGLSFLRELRNEPNGHEPSWCSARSKTTWSTSSRPGRRADEYIMKPFDGDILEAKLTEAGLVT